MDPIFSLTLKKQWENRGFQLHPLKILRKSNDFHLKSSKLAIGGQDKADRAEARHSKRASRAKAEHSRRGGRAKPGNTLFKNLLLMCREGGWEWAKLFVSLGMCT